MAEAVREYWSFTVDEFDTIKRIAERTGCQVHLQRGPSFTPGQVTVEQEFGVRVIQTPSATVPAP